MKRNRRGRRTKFSGDDEEVESQSRATAIINVEQRVSRFSRRKRLSYRTLETERWPTPPGNQGGTGLGRVRSGGWIAPVQGYRFYERSERVLIGKKVRFGVGILEKRSFLQGKIN